MEVIGVFSNYKKELKKHNTLYSIKAFAIFEKINLLLIVKMD